MENVEFIDIYETEFEELIHNSDPNNATGPDDISLNLLREAGSATAPSLTRLINLSLPKSQIPKQWKRVNVTPISKHPVTLA